MLYELIYSSRANSNFKSSVLDDILTISRKNNTANNITGLLIFDGNTFCQILEGEKEALSMTYDKIKNDNRHIDHTLFHQGEIAQRNFSQWAMSYKRTQKAASVENWTDWFSAQKLISDISPDNTLGGLILKTVNGSNASEGSNLLGLR